MRIVVAIGGNALIRAGEAGTWEEQLANAREIAEEVVALRAAGHEVVLTHGNGPQVGALLLQQALGEARGAAAAARRADRDDAGADRLPARDGDRAGRPVGADRGAAHARAGRPATTRRSRRRRSRSARSTTTSEARPARATSAAGTWRRTPAAAGAASSPARGRSRCSATDHVRALLERGAVVIAGGGGGIPVAPAGAGVDGVPGVIDKDRCSAELALAVGADLLVLLTGVPRVALDFGTRWERELATDHGVRRGARPGRAASSRPAAWARRSSRPSASSRRAAAAR